MAKDRILLVEDDKELSFITGLRLEDKGYEVLMAESAEEAEKQVMEYPFAAIIMDFLLPDLDGIALCRKIRKRVFCPILFASCVGDKKTIVEALKNGGDDYIVKPVEHEELAARIEANIRRCRYYGKTRPDESEVWCKQFMIDKGIRKVWRVDHNGKKGESIDLSPTEYKLLLMFTEKPDILLLYNEMYRYIWEREDLGDVRTVMVHVSNLRKKIDFDKTDVISTVRSAGYIFSDV